MPLRLRLARGLLLAAWLTPIWGPLASQFLPSPSLGSGFLDSDRTLLLMLSLWATALTFPELLRRSLPVDLKILLLFLVWAGLSTANSLEVAGSALFLQQWIAAVLLALCVTHTKPNFSTTVAWWTVHGPALALAATALAPLLFDQDKGRASDPFGLPGALATWVLLLLPLALYELIFSQGARFAAGLGSTALLCNTLAMTGSRGAWLVGLLQIVVLLIWFNPRQNLRRLILWLCFLGIGVGVLAAFRSSLGGLGLTLGVLLLAGIPLALEALSYKLPRTFLLKAGAVLFLSAALFWTIESVRPSPGLFDAAQQRLTSLVSEDRSAEARVVFWGAALKITRDFPVFGAGPAQFKIAYPTFQERLIWYSDSPHSAFLELLCDTGLPGGLLILTAFCLMLRRNLLAPELEPGKKAMLAGLVSVALYSQIEVGYHFATLLVGVGLLWGSTAATPDPRSQQAREPSRAQLLVMVAATLLGTAFLWPLFRTERLLEVARHTNAVLPSYDMAREASDRAPWWPKAAATALQKGLRTDVPTSELEILSVRLLDTGSRSASSFFLAGELEYKKGDFQTARRLYQMALERDRLNYPSVYHSLLLIAGNLGEGQETSRLQHEILQEYRLSDLQVFHTAHRNNLTEQLVPLMYDLADSLGPYDHPEKVEPIYRELLEIEVTPRGLHGLGVALWTQGQFAEGFLYLQKAHAMDPVYPSPPPLPTSPP